MHVVTDRDIAHPGYNTYISRINYVGGGFLFHLLINTIDYLSNIGPYKHSRVIGADPVLTTVAVIRCAGVDC